MYNENIVALQNTAAQLATRPQSSSAYQLRLYPLSLERSALIAQLAAEEENAHDAVRIAYEEERDRVEEEYRKGRDRVRERLLEGIEERRRRAREEKDGEGISGEYGFVGLPSMSANPTALLFPPKTRHWMPSPAHISHASSATSSVAHHLPHPMALTEVTVRGTHRHREQHFPPLSYLCPIPIPSLSTSYHLHSLSLLRLRPHQAGIRTAADRNDVTRVGVGSRWRLRA